MFAGLIGGSTPQYKGLAQPTAPTRGGLFGLITGIFAPSAHTYARPQPEAAVIPTTAPASSPTVSADQDEASGELEPQAKHITIIVRPGPGTSVEEVVQFLQDRCLDD